MRIKPMQGRERTESMKMNEKHHARLVALWYKELRERFGDRGIGTFINATKAYTRQRGGRKAIRAEKHGYKKDYLAYFVHKEWASEDPTFFEADQYLLENGDLVTKVKKCPWNSVFKEMGMLECGDLYCRFLDEYLVEGFNSDLVLDMASTLHYGGMCHFNWRITGFGEGWEEEISRGVERWHDENVLPFTYHVAHLYHTFKETVEDELAETGKKVADSVLQEFTRKYGEEASRTILAHGDIDFDLVPEMQMVEMQ